MLRNICKSVVLHKIIKTTISKAKEIRRFLEPIINLAKNDSLNNKRIAFQRLRDKNIVYRIFETFSNLKRPKNSGYLKIIKCNFRKGDNSPMAYLILDLDTNI